MPRLTKLKRTEKMTHNIENADRTLSKLLEKIQARANAVQDYISPTNQLVYRTTEKPGWSDSNSKVSEIILEGQGGEPTRSLGVNSVSFDQIARDADIDVRTARRLQQGYSDQWDGLVNAIWQKEPKNRMVRTFMANDRQGTARAFVSDKFKTYDDLDLAKTVLPELMESDAQWQIQQADITDKRMYMRFRSNAITGEGANVGDLMALGLGVSNSEVGMGSIQVFQINWTLACLNGMQTENRHRKSHITSARGDSEVWSVLSDEAKIADNAALSLKLRDLVRNYASRESFELVLEKMRQAAGDVIEGDYTQGAVNQLGKVLALPKKQTANILDGLIATVGQSGYENNRPISRATLLNAVTACAHKADADSVDDWQKLGGDVLNMRPADWASISRASIAA